MRHAAPRGASADLRGHGYDMEASGPGCLGCARVECRARRRAAWAQQTWHTPDVPTLLLSPHRCTPACFGDISSFGVAAHPVMSNLEILDTWLNASLPRKKISGQRTMTYPEKRAAAPLSLPLLSATSNLPDISEVSSCPTK